MPLQAKHLKYFFYTTSSDNYILIIESLTNFNIIIYPSKSQRSQKFNLLSSHIAGPTFVTVTLLSLPQFCFLRTHSLSYHFPSLPHTRDFLLLAHDRKQYLSVRIQHIIYDCMSLIGHMVIHICII